MDQYGFYGDVSYADEYLHRYRPYNRSTGMNGLGSTVTSGNYRGALGRVHYGQRPTSRGSDFAMMRGLGMTPAGPRMAGLGDAASDQALCRTLATVGHEVLNALSSGVRPRDLPAGSSASAVQTRQREQAEFDRVSGSVSGSGAALINFCNLINASASQSTPTGGPSAWEIEQARRAYEDSQRQGSKKMMQMALLVGGGVAAAAAVYFLLK